MRYCWAMILGAQNAGIIAVSMYVFYGRFQNRKKRGNLSTETWNFRYITLTFHVIIDCFKTHFFFIQNMMQNISNHYIILCFFLEYQLERTKNGSAYNAREHVLFILNVMDVWVLSRFYDWNTFVQSFSTDMLMEIIWPQAAKRIENTCWSPYNTVTTRKNWDRRKYYFFHCP